MSSNVTGHARKRIARNAARISHLCLIVPLMFADPVIAQDAPVDSGYPDIDAVVNDAQFA